MSTSTRRYSSRIELATASAARPSNLPERVALVQQLLHVAVPQRARHHEHDVVDHVADDAQVHELCELARGGGAHGVPVVDELRGRPLDEQGRGEGAGDVCEVRAVVGGGLFFEF